jgi:hypothetical protein
MPSARNGCGSYCKVVLASRWIAAISASGTGSGWPPMPTRSATPTTFNTRSRSTSGKRAKQ